MPAFLNPSNYQNRIDILCTSQNSHAVIEQILRRDTSVVPQKVHHHPSVDIDDSPSDSTPSPKSCCSCCPKLLLEIQALRSEMETIKLSSSEILKALQTHSSFANNSLNKLDSENSLKMSKPQDSLNYKIIKSRTERSKREKGHSLGNLVSIISRDNNSEQNSLVKTIHDDCISSAESNQDSQKHNIVQKRKVKSKGQKKKSVSNLVSIISDENRSETSSLLDECSSAECLSDHRNGSSSNALPVNTHTYTMDKLNFPTEMSVLTLGEKVDHSRMNHIVPNATKFYDSEQCIFVHGIPESESLSSKDKLKDDLRHFNECLSDLLPDGEDYTILKALRIGRISDSTRTEIRPRPLKIILSDPNQVSKLLQRKYLLKENTPGVFFQPEYHPKEREKRKELVVELKRRIQSGENGLRISNGTIVKKVKNFLWADPITMKVNRAHEI
jgi:hypothetical protein